MYIYIYCNDNKEPLKVAEVIMKAPMLGSGLGFGRFRFIATLTFCHLGPVVDGYPDPREDLESRSPNLGPYTTKGTL